MSLFYSGSMTFGICVSSRRRSINITTIMVRNVKTVLFSFLKILTSAVSGFVNSSEDSNLQNKKGLTQFNPQSGFETTLGVLALLKDVAKFSNITLDDLVIKEIEGISALFINLRECKTFTHLSSAIFLYIRSMCTTSVWTCVSGYIELILKDVPFDTQSDLLQPSWLKLLQDIQGNWSLVKENRTFKQFSKLMSICVTLGLCKVSDLTFDIGGFKLFDETLFKRHLSAFDLADAIFGTVTYFAEGMYLCFQTGSIQPLLLNDFSIMELDNEHINILMWWDLVKNGNLEKILGISDAEFSHRLDKLIARMTNLIPSLTGFDKKLLSDKLLKLKLIKNDLISMKISSGTRRAPFAIELFGESSQGKTTFGDLLLDALLVSAGLPVDKEYRAALNPGDKFYSNWTSDKLVAILDDLSNEKADFVEKAPTRAVIDFCNNQMFYAPKAELDAKGKCFVEPEIVLVTTNKKDLDAYAYSNCPYSIQRRMNLVMTVKCKEQFQRCVEVAGVKRYIGVDSSKIREYYTNDDGVYIPPLIDDIWEIDVEQAVKPDELRNVASYEPIQFNGRSMVRLSALEAIQLAIEHYKVHRNNQFMIMHNMNSRNSAMERCGIDGCCHIKGCCPYHYDKQFGFELASACVKIQRRITTSFNVSRKEYENIFEKYATDKIYSFADGIYGSIDWVWFIPPSWLENEYVLRFAEHNCKWQLDSRRNSVHIFCCVLFVLCLFSNFYISCILLFFIYFLLGLVTRKAMRKVLQDELLRRNDTLPIMFKSMRDKYARDICSVCAALSCLYLLSKVYTHWKNICPAQGNLEPETIDDIKERDGEISPWSIVVKREVPVSHKCASSTIDQIEQLVKKNLFYASVVTNDSRLMANVLFLRTNLIMLPNHYFGNNDELELECFKDEPSSIGGKFKTRVSKKISYLIPQSDLRICYVASGGSFKDIIEYLPLSRPVGSQFSRMIWRKKDGEIIGANAVLGFKNTTNGEVQFYGATYGNMSIPTFQGMCGAVWIAEASKPFISGFHLGGIAGTPRGCCGLLIKSDVDDAIHNINKSGVAILTGSDSEFRPHMFGVKTMINNDLHRKSPLNYLPEGSQFNYYGSCVGAATSYSCVRTTPISAAVTHVCGVANIWGPPKFKPEWYGWQKCLHNASIPAHEFDYESLAWAIDDYKGVLIKEINKKHWSVLRPLTRKENINGIPGFKFIDAINMKTSMGFPLTGPKSKYIIDMEQKDDKGLYDRHFLPEVMQEITEAEHKYTIGMRNHFVAKGCKKDEALVVSKEKCRIFYGNSIVLTYLIRKYYLPIVRFIGMNPLLAECAVGINCHGREWDQMYKHVTKYGLDTLIGGDYGKYDQKLPSQLILSALRILIDLARVCNYSDNDIKVMETMCADIVYSYIAFNGDLVSVTSGTHISGNSLTVLINSICGSLNMRVCFYKLYGHAHSFRDCVSLITYGDDNIGSVNARFADFNIVSCSKILEAYGQEYTMPDKTSQLKVFLNINEFEFLKRTNVYHHDLKCNIGALSENSIFKSLHCYLRPKKCALTPSEACAINIDGALREWFNHGREIYETRRYHMRQVLDNCGLCHRSNMIDRTFDDCVELWLQNQLEIYTFVDGDSDDFIAQSGFEFEDLYLRAQDEINMALLSMNQVIIHQDFGEVDMIFKRVYDGVPHYLVLEIKHSHCQGVRRKGRAQLRRVSYALHYLQPRMPILAVLLTPFGYELVEEHGGEGMWHRFNLPFSGMVRT